MKRIVPYLYFLSLTVLSVQCSSEKSVHQKASVSLPLLLQFDWRMGATDTIRAGSALMVRCTWNAEERKIERFYVLDNSDAQWGIMPMLTTVIGKQNVLGILSFSPEETARLAAGEYTMKVEGVFQNGVEFSSSLIQFHLYPAQTTLSDDAILNERQRFAAFLLLRNDTASYETIAPLIQKNKASKQSTLANQLNLYYRYAVRPHSKEVQEEGYALIEALKRNSTLTLGEHERYNLLDEEIRLRHEDIKNDR